MSSVPKLNGDCQGLGLCDLLEGRAGRTPDAAAVLAPGRAPLTYGGLRDHVGRVVTALNALGVGRNDRVAVVLPNGPEMAVAFLGVAAAATCAPLNPAYRANEFDFYLSDLKAKALVIQSGLDSPARAVAQARGIPLLELVPATGAEAGLFTLRGGAVGSPPACAGPARAGDCALVLHTSGTTSRPKIVPLTQANLCASARNIQASLRLAEGDRCLNIMPLFHIHGLVGAVLSSLAAGASVVCAPGFEAPRFFEWLETFRPTWYTAVPTMHQAILARAPANRDVIARCPLRFVRSCSSALPPQLMAEMEDVFRAPVIEAYGMTEASHQMTSNPLPPGQRKPGSVGVAAGPEVAVMDEAGRLLPPGRSGEVVIRGPNVTAGYENNPPANQEAFTGGWFRTGDQGYQDEEGYLFLTGRIKELINRGGEKVSPREVDEVLLDHPAVAQAVAFAVPDAKLGEEVAAAVVLREQASTTEREVQEFAAARLADFKVPRRVLILPEIPKGPTGKLQRIGLAEKLGLKTVGAPPSGEAEFTPPRTPTEEVLAKLWMKVLRREKVGVRDDFFQIGGDSVLAAALFAEIFKSFGQRLPLATLFGGATIEYLGRVLDQHTAPPASLIALQPHGSGPPFFCVHGAGGDVFSFGDLVPHLRPDQPFYALQLPWSDQGEPALHSIEEMAAHYLQEVRALQPEGPYFLGGLCFGGTVAFEMAQQLHAQGQPVALLAILDQRAPDTGSGRGFWRPSSLVHTLGNTYYWVREELRENGFRRFWPLARGKARAAARRVGNLFRRSGPRSRAVDLVESAFDTSRLPEAFRKTVEVTYQALLQYVPGVYPGRVTLIRARAQSPLRVTTYDLGWERLAGGGLEVTVVPGNHATFLKRPWVQALAEQLGDHIQKAQARQGGGAPELPAGPGRAA